MGQQTEDFYFVEDESHNTTMNREEPSFLSWEEGLRGRRPANCKPEELEDNILQIQGHPQLLQLKQLAVDDLGQITVACFINNGDKRIQTRSGFVLQPRGSQLIKTFLVNHYQPDLLLIKTRGQGFFCFSCHKFVKATHSWKKIDDFEDHLMRHLTTRCPMGVVTLHPDAKVRLQRALKARFTAEQSASPREHLGAVHADLADGQQQIKNDLGEVRAEVRSGVNWLGARLRDFAETQEQLIA